MLVITRKLSERIMIAGGITIQVVEIRGTKQVRIGIEAPDETSIWREEVYVEKLKSGELTVDGSLIAPP